MDSQPPAADLQSALSRLRGDRELLGDMIDYFLDDSPGLTETLNHAIEQGDFQSAQRAAHSLKGLASTFDAHQAAAAASDVERAAQAEDLELVQDRLSNCHAQMDCLRSYLISHRG